MIRSVFLLLFVLFARVASGQVLISILFGDKLNTEKLEFGLVVSPSLCNITNIDAKYRPVLSLGLYFNVQISSKFYFHPEAVPKSALGANKISPYPLGDPGVDTLFAGGSVQRKVKAISLPLLMRYRLTGLWFIEAGPQIDWNLRANDEFTVKSGDNHLTNTVDVESQFTRFDVGVAGGLVYRFREKISMAMGIRYFYGLTDIMKSEPGVQHNSVWLLNIEIPIGAGKAAEKRQKKQA